MEQPKCKMKALKCNLETILRKDTSYSWFQECIKRSNYISFLCSHFIRLYVLHKFNNSKTIPNIDKQFILIVFSVLSKPTSGKPMNSENQTMYDELDDFYKKHFSKLIENNKFDSVNLPHIWNYIATEMATSYTNNIRFNFIKYLNQFVNCLFIKKECEISKRTETEVRKDKPFMKSIMNIKLDLLNGTNKSDEKFHNWIKSVRENFLPQVETGIETINDDVNINPFKYWKVMLKMNQILENNGMKMFQPVPLKSEFNNGYLLFDTLAIRDIFEENGIHKIDKTDEQLWNYYFPINFNKFKIKGYRFINLISTDGTSVSILFVENSEYPKIQEKNKIFAEKRKETATKKQELSEEDYKKYLKSKKEETKKNSAEQQKKRYKIKREAKEAFSKLPKKEQEEIQLKIRLKNNEFNYIEDVVHVDNILEMLKEAFKLGNIATGDPGMVAPITLGKKNKNKFDIFSYTCQQRLKGTKRIKYNKLRIHKYTKMINNDNLTIILENKLKEYSNKTTGYHTFSHCIWLKLQLLKLIEKKVFEEYQKYNQKLRWFAYINKRRHEDELLNTIEKKFGKNLIIIIGDWDYTSGIKHKSVPNIGLLRLLRKRFQVYLINEFNTSKKNCKTLVDNKNLICECNPSKRELKKHKLENEKIRETNEKNKEHGIKEIVLEKPELKPEIKEIHRVFTFKMSNERLGCINRDVNSVINMMNIVEHLLEYKSRPKEFTRIANVDSPLSENSNVKESNASTIASCSRVHNRCKQLTQKISKR